MLAARSGPVTKGRSTLTRCTGMLALAAAIAMPVEAVHAETLRDAMIAAYRNNPTLTGARATQRATDESVPIAAANGRPSTQAQITYSENFLRSANSFTAPSRQLSSGLNLSVPVYSGGGVRNAVQAAKMRVDAGQSDLRGTEANIFSLVVGAYMDVIRDEAVVSLNRSNVEVLQVNLQASRDRFEIGDLTRTDVAQSESRLALAISDLRTAEANLIQSRETYIQLVGKEPGDLEPPPPLPPLPGNPEQAVDVALDNNPALIAARVRSEAAQYDIKSAEANRWPTIDLFAQGNYTNFFGTLGGAFVGEADFVQEQSTAAVGAQITVPLYQGGRPAAQIRQAQARSSAAFEAEIEAERRVVADTRAAYASWRASLEVIASSQQAIDANRLALEGVRAEQSVGNRQVLDVLNAEQELLNSQVQLVSARRNAYVAGFALLAAMGRAEARDLGLDGGALYDPEVNYQRVYDKINDYQSDPDPLPVATRTLDTQPQTAEVPETSMDEQVQREY